MLQGRTAQQESKVLHSQNRKRKKTEKLTLFSDHNGSLLRRMPGAFSKQQGALVFTFRLAVILPPLSLHCCKGKEEGG